VPHGVGWYDGRPAFYSLGNLVFPMHKDYPWTGTGFVARLTFTSRGRLSVEACPYRILGHTPMPFEDKDRAAQNRRFVRHLSHVSITVGGTTIGEPGPDGCMPLSAVERASLAERSSRSRMR
jgi:poly-gamma-glutamate capsule biosynthesis protein CapA/YwtB (metallophosphatase superfamily)